jgi:ribose-phosphate pyrophosphokinase
VLTGKAVERITASPMEHVTVTDTIPATEAVTACKKIRYLSVAPLLAEAVERISQERSVSSLFT